MLPLTRPPKLPGVTAHAFSDDERRAVYRAILERRDMREFVAGATVPAPLTVPSGLPAAYRRPRSTARVRDPGALGKGWAESSAG